MLYSCQLQTNRTALSLVKPMDPNDPEQYPSDLTIKCGSLDVKAHSHILCQSSSYFNVVCKGGFLVSWHLRRVETSRFADISQGRANANAQSPRRRRVLDPSPLMLSLHDRLQRLALRRRDNPTSTHRGSGLRQLTGSECSNVQHSRQV